MEFRLGGGDDNDNDNYDNYGDGGGGVGRWAYWKPGINPGLVRVCPNGTPRSGGPGPGVSKRHTRKHERVRVCLNGTPGNPGRVRVCPNGRKSGSGRAGPGRHPALVVALHKHQVR